MPIPGFSEGACSARRLASRAVWFCCAAMLLASPPTLAVNLWDAGFLVVDGGNRKLYGIDLVRALQDGHCQNAILFSRTLDSAGVAIAARPLGVAAAGGELRGSFRHRGLF